jgi:HAD superfamily hydrolase (TIGR01509 family)
LKPNAAIFDLDGLMLDTERSFIRNFQESADKLSWNVPTETLTQTIGIDRYRTKELLCSRLGGDFPFDDVYADAIKKQSETFERDGIPHLPGLLVLLDSLKAKRIPLAVATSTWAERGRWKLKCGGIEGYFDAVVTGDQVERGKPAPDIFLRAAALLGRSPAECVGFEDSPAGLLALRAAGIRSVFIKDMLEPPPDVLRLVWKRCASLADAVSLF